MLERVSKRREVSSIVCLVAPLAGRPARLYARHFTSTVHAREVIVALDYFRRRIGCPLVVIWDRLNAHRAHEVEHFLAAHPEDFQVEWLPAYAPELNPTEQGNSIVKRAMANALPESVEALLCTARREFRRLGRRPEVLARFFAHAGLNVT